MPEDEEGALGHLVAGEGEGGVERVSPGGRTLTAARPSTGNPTKMLLITLTVSSQ